MGKDLSKIPIAIKICGERLLALSPIYLSIPFFTTDRFTYIISFKDRISKMHVMITAPKSNHKPIGFFFCSTIEFDKYPVLRNAVVIGL